VIAADAHQATIELIDAYGAEVIIDGKNTRCFIEDEITSPAYDDQGGMVDAAALLIIGTVEALDAVKVHSPVVNEGREYRVTEKNKVAGCIQLTCVDASSR
jgi:hypothetical protein